jgi:hypothetical protein
MKAAVLLLALLLAATAATDSPAQTPVSNELVRIGAVFDAELKKVLGDAAARLKTWPETYTRELADLRAKTQQDGDLDGMLAVDAEWKRFKADPTLPDSVVSSVPDAVRKIQMRYRDQPLQVAVARDQQVLEVARRYRERLAAMQKDLTRSGDIQSALLVRQELARVAALPAVTAAEFTAAERSVSVSGTGSVAKAVEPAPPAPPKPVAPPPAPQKVAPRKVDLAGGFRLADKSTGLAVSAYRPLGLNNTEGARIPKARAEVAVNEREPSDDTVSTSMYGSYRGKSGETTISTRVTVRASGSAEIEGATLAVQWFTRDLSSKGGGRIVPEEAMSSVTPLPTLTSQGMVLDGPPFGYYSSSYKYRSAYHSSTSRYGREFLGVVVSIFGGDGTLLYQGASQNALEKYAATRVPTPVKNDMRRDFPARFE